MSVMEISSSNIMVEEREVKVMMINSSSDSLSTTTLTTTKPEPLPPPLESLPLPCHLTLKQEPSTSLTPPPPTPTMTTTTTTTTTSITTATTSATTITTTRESYYWKDPHFWPTFLADKNFDHWHFIEVFKVILANGFYRKRILQSLFPQLSLCFADCDSCKNTVNDHLQHIKSIFQYSQQRKSPTIVTWKYPPIHEDGIEEVSHYTVFFIHPYERYIASFDSRGIDFASNCHPTWKYCLDTIQLLAKEMKYQWVDMNFFDIQEPIEHDHFCQTWSMLMLIEYLSHYLLDCQQQQQQQQQQLLLEQQQQGHFKTIRHGIVSRYDQTFLYRLLPKHGYQAIVTFWRFIVSDLVFIREAIYYNIYRQTHHENGERYYNRYFSTLESLVHESNTIYYSYEDHYDEKGYMFLEDFLGYLNESILRDILT